MEDGVGDVVSASSAFKPLTERGSSWTTTVMPCARERTFDSSQCLQSENLFWTYPQVKWPTALPTDVLVHNLKTATGQQFFDVTKLRGPRPAIGSQQSVLRF